MNAFIKELLDDAAKIDADCKAGRLILLHGGLISPEDLDRVIFTDGGAIWPSSVGYAA